MRKTKQLTALILSLVSAFGSAAAFSGCGREEGEAIDKNRTQLYVSTYSGGYGADWLYSLKDRFETAFENKRYETGKKGVQIIVDDAEASGSTIALSANSNEVIFTESVPYYNWVKSKSIVDISDVVTYIAQNGVDLYQSQKDALTALDGAYYAIPHYEGYYGLVYDKDLFNTKSFYISKDGGFTNASGNRTVGPDGKTGEIDGVDYTLDDGLPATWEEFFNLCTWMKVYNSVTPLMLAGGVADSYSRRFLDRICTSYMGSQMQSWYSFEGQVDYVESTTEDNSSLFGYKMNIKKGEPISEENGYLLRQMPGRIVALSVLEKMADEKYFNMEALEDASSNTDSQETYINSTPKNTPIAMMIEGSWWENEAKSAFGRSIGNYPSYYPNKSKNDRKFGYMPLPTKITASDENVGDSSLSMEYLRAYAFINKSSTEDWKIGLAKDFLRFAYLPENLEKYTEETGTVRAMQYQISSTTYNGLSSFGQDLWNTHKNGKVLYKLSDKKIYIDNESDFTDTWGTANYTSPFKPLYDGLSSVNYYNGTLLLQSKWNDSYSEYFNK